MLAKHSREQNVPCGQLEVGDQRLRHVTETGSELASPTYSPYIHREIPPPSFACTVFAAVWVVWQQNGTAVQYTTVKPVLKTCTSSHALLSHPVMGSKLAWLSQTREEAYPWITFRDGDTSVVDCNIRRQTCIALNQCYLRVYFHLAYSD